MAFLRGAFLRGAFLRGAFLRGAFLRGLTPNDFFRAASFFTVVLLTSALSASEKLSLEEPFTDQRPVSVAAKVNIEGTLETVISAEKSQTLKLRAEATLRYRQRRLPSAGRDADSVRALRFYEQAGTEITVDEQTSRARLRPERRLIVAHGREDGLQLYNPDGPLLSGELDVIEMPGDDLCFLGMLPSIPVEVKQSWSPNPWVVQMLTGCEAVTKSHLKCQLQSADDGSAVVTFQGNVEGATLGAATKIAVGGRFIYDLQSHIIRHAELTQTETRSVGAVSPGMKVVAKVALNRKLASSVPAIDQRLTAIPLEIDPIYLRLSMQTPWGSRLTHGRDWHVFHQTENVSVLRLLVQGNLIAQCNLSPVPTLSPGQHTPSARFEADIATALGKQMTKIAEQQIIPSKGPNYIYRVLAQGKVGEVPMNWIYYLVAGPDGRQNALVFAVEQSLAEKLANRDLEIVHSIEFLPIKLPEQR